MKNRIFGASLIAIASFLYQPSTGRAADGTWINASGGLWSDTLNWQGGIIADDTGFRALFNTLDVSSDSTIQLDTARTISGLSFLDTNRVSAAGFTLNDAGNGANVLTLGAAPTISVGQLGTGKSVSIETILSGVAGVSKTGLGNLTLSRGNTYTGTTILAGGGVSLDFANAGAPASNIIPSASALSFTASTHLTLSGKVGIATTQGVASTAFGGGLHQVTVTPGAGGSLSLALSAITGTVGTTAPSVRIHNTGTITASTTTSTLGIIGNGGPSGTAASAGYITFGLNDFAAINAGNVVAGSTVAGFYNNTVPSSATSSGNWDVIANATLATGQKASTSTRFNTAAALTITLANSNLWTNTGVLVTPNVGANNTTISTAGTTGVMQVLRVTSPTGTQQASFWQNNTLGFLSMGNIANGRDAGDNNYLVKAGAGTMVLTGTNNTFAGRTIVNEGTLVATLDAHLGAANTGLTLDGGTFFANATFTAAAGRGVTVNSSGTLAASTGNILTVDGAIGGNGRLTIGSGTLVGTGPGTANTTAIVGDGLVILNGGNFFFGGAEIAAGTLRINGVNALGGANYGGLTLSGGTLQYATSLTSGPDITLPGAGMPASNQAVSLTSGTSTLDTNGNSMTYANPIGNGGAGSLIKAGAGSLTLTGANSYTGSTAVNGGTLHVLGSLAGSASIASGATLSSGGTISGGITTANASTLIPGNSAVGTLTTSSLSLGAGTLLTYEMTTTGNDLISVTASDGLTINGGAITLVTPGTSTPFVEPGTYNLIGYTGTISGAGITTLSVANPQAGYSYSFSSSGGFVKVTIIQTSTLTKWAFDGSGNWDLGTNWTNGIPNSNTSVSVFDLALTAPPSSVTLDGSKTLNGMLFNTAATYNLINGTSGSLSLVLNGIDAAPPSIQVQMGTPVIAVPVTISGSTAISVSTGASLTLSGIVSGGASISKSGPGLLDLTGANTFTGNVTVTGGTLGFATGASLGTGAALSLDNATLLYGVGNTADVSTKAISLGALGATVDTNGNDVTWANAFTGAGALTKNGLGKLILGSANTYAGATTVNAGTLSISSNSAIGTPSLAAALTLNGATLETTATLTLDDAGVNPRTVNLGAAGASFDVAATTTLTIPSAFGGTGALIKTGAGTLNWPNAAPFGRNITISAGDIQVHNATTLGSSLVTADSTNALTFGSGLTALNIGALAGTGGVNFLTNNVSLTLGSALSGSFSGTMSGTSLTKVGTGTQTFAGVNTMTGNTNVASGTLEVTTGGVYPGNAITLNGVSSAKLLISGGEVTGSSYFNGNGCPGLEVTAGSLTLTGNLSMTDNANQGVAMRLSGGSINATSLIINRSSLTLVAEPAAGDAANGFLMSGGTLNLSGNIELGLPTGANSSVSMLLTGGTANITGTVTIGLNNGGRWSVIDVAGANFNNTNAAGIAVGGPSAGSAAFLVRAGTATVEGILLRARPGATSVLNVSGTGTLYVGANGIGFTDFAGNNGVNIARLNGGVLAAKAPWSSSLPWVTSGVAEIKAADAAGAAQNITLSGVLSGSAAINKTGDGTLFYLADNNYTGSTNILAGTLQLGNGGTTGGIASAAAMINNGTLRINRSSSLTLAQDISGTGALIQEGTGTTTLSGVAVSYTGATTVSAGRLSVLTALASPITVNGGLLTGSGSTTAATTVAATAGIAPGDNGVGTFTTGELTLANNSNLYIEVSGLPANDQITVTTADKLTLNGGSIYLYNAGGTTAFAPVSGTTVLTLINYTGTLAGSITNLTVANPQPGRSYVFSTTGTQVQLTVSVTGLVTEWNLTSGGTWPLIANWTNGIPDSNDAVALALSRITAPSILTLDGPRQVNFLGFDNANAYTIAPGTGGTLTLVKNATTNALPGMIVTAGSHSITADMAVAEATNLETAGSSSLSLSGVVSGSFPITKQGTGTLELYGLNTFNGGFSILGGSVGFNTIQALGTGPVTVNGATMKWAPASSADLSALTVTVGFNNAILDTNGNNITFANSFGNSGTGAVIKQGLGVLTLAAANTWTGPTFVDAGAISLSADNQLGTIPLAPALPATLFLNGGDLHTTATYAQTRPLNFIAVPSKVDVATGTTLTQSGLITGAGAFTKTGAGTLELTGANRAAGWSSPVELQGGTVVLGGGQPNGQQGMGSGPITFRNGAVLTMQGNAADNTSGWGALNNLITVPTGETGTLNMTTRGDISGGLAGAGTLNFNVNNVRGNVILSGDWAGFTGTLNIGPTGAGTDDFRVAAGRFNIPAARVHLKAGVFVVQTYNPPSGTGTETQHIIGQLSGEAGSTLAGNPVSGRFANWVVGALNTDSEFAGAINNGTGASRLTKVGTGTLTLSGTSNTTGDLSANGGTLRLTGTSTSAWIHANAGGIFLIEGTATSPATWANTGGQLIISSTGTLTHTGTEILVTGSLENQGILNGPVTLESGGLYKGIGMLNGNLAVDAGGIIDQRNNAINTLAITGNVTTTAGAIFHVELSDTAADKHVITGDLTFNGTTTINVSSLSGLATPGSYDLFTYTGLLAGGTNLVVGTTPPGIFSYAIDTATSGVVKLVISGTAAPTGAYWFGAIDGGWASAAGNSTNWRTDLAGTTDTQQLPGALTDIIFTATGATNLTTTLAVPLSVKSLTFNSTAPASSIGGSAALTLGSGGLALASGSAAQIISAPITAAISQTWTNASAADLTLASSFTGTGTVTFAHSSTGRTLLSGNNTGFLGGFTADSGSLVVGSSSAFGTATLSVSPTGTVDLNGFSTTVANLQGAGTLTDLIGTGSLTLLSGSFSGSIASGAGSLSVTKAGPSVLTLTGSNAFTGAITISAGTLQVAADSALGAGSSPVQLGDGTLEFISPNTASTRAITATGSTSTLKVDTATQVLAGTLSGARIQTAGSGTLELTGSSSAFSSGFLLGTGSTLRAGTADALGTGTVNVGAGTLDVNGLAIANPITTSTGLAGALLNNGATPVTLTSSITVGSSTLSVGGSNGLALPPLSALAGGRVQKVGTGTVSLTGSVDNLHLGAEVLAGILLLDGASSPTVHTLGGPVTLSGGTLRLAGSGGDQISNTVSVALNQGTLDLAALSETVDALNGTHTAGIFGTVTSSLPGTATLTVGAANGSGTFAGLIQDGAPTHIVALVKSGSGTQTLSSASTYTGGTTVTGGSLTLTNTSGSATGSGPVTIQNGATLAGTGTSISTSITLSGALQPGVAGVGTLSLSAPLTLSSTASARFEITSATTADKVTSITDLTLDGSLTVVFAGTYTAASLVGGETYDLVDWSGTLDSAAFTPATDLILPDISTAGYVWDTTQFLTTGVIKVRSSGPASGLVTPATAQTSSGATLHGLVTSSGDAAPSVTLYYGTTDGAADIGAWASSVALSGTVSEGNTFSQAISSLLPGTRYYFRALFTNASGTRWSSNSHTFVTLGDVEIADWNFEARGLTTGSVASVTPWIVSTNGAGWIEALGFHGDPTASLMITAGNTVRQDLGVTFEANTRYTLTVAVGRRTGITTAANASSYILADSTGTQWQAGSINASTLTADAFTDQSITLDTLEHPDAVGRTLRIILGSAGSRSMFDTVRITKTPSSQAGRPLGIILSAVDTEVDYATMRAQVTDSGSSAAQATFYFGTVDQGDTTAGWDNSAVASGTHLTGATVTLTQSALVPLVTYYYRVRFENGSGGTWAAGAGTFFIDTNPASVTNSTASNITATRATLGGTPAGRFRPYTLTVYYGTTDGGTVPANWAHQRSLGSATTTTVGEVTGLTPNTTYFYRCFVDSTYPETAWAATSSSFSTTPQMPPVADTLSLRGVMNDTLTGQLTGTEQDSLPLTFSKATDPAHGSVLVNSDGSFLYTPTASYVGTDSFTFLASRLGIDSAPATVSLLITSGPPNWVWKGGANLPGNKGSYGTKNVTTPTNLPGARQDAASATDDAGNLWVFGGTGWSTSTTAGPLNDLWKRDALTGQWTWISGTNVTATAGIYGTKNVASTANSPGARTAARTWFGTDGHLYLFGGSGRDSGPLATSTGPLNDLWRFNVTTAEWTWLTGDNLAKKNGVYGTQGIAAPANTPGSRSGHAIWQDAQGHTYLFGGKGLAEAGTLISNLSDLWKFDGTQWTWLKGAKTPDQAGIYGTQGVAAHTSAPGARSFPTTWAAPTGTLWMFGGNGKGSTATAGMLSDLWKYDPTANEWTWVRGASTISSLGIYGTLGTPAAANQPGARQGSVAWTSADGSLKLFGGQGTAYWNDVWSYNVFTNQWTWIKGPNTASGAPLYGQLNVSTVSSTPGARRAGIPYVDKAGDLWLIGGGQATHNNDIWQLDLEAQPTAVTLAASSVTDTAATLSSVVHGATSPVSARFRYWKAGSTAQLTSLTTINDGSAEAAHSIAITGLTPATTYYYVAEAVTPFSTGLGRVSYFTTSGTATPPHLRFTSTSLIVHESAGTVAVAVDLGSPATTPFTAPFTLSGTATAPADYLAPPLSLAFVPGQQRASISISIINDTLVDAASETIILTLGAPTSGVTADTGSPATITLLDDDAAPTVTPSTARSVLGALGTSTALSVTAASSAPVTYQWQKAGVNIPGATAATYTIVGTPLTASNTYQCLVKNATGTTTSGLFTLGVVDRAGRAPTIIPVAGSTTFTVSTSTGLTYRWKRVVDPLDDTTWTDVLGTGYAGTSTATLSISNATAGHSGTYVCSVQRGVSAQMYSGFYKLEVGITAVPVLTSITRLPTAVVGSAYSYQIGFDPSILRKPTSFTAVGLPLGLTVSTTGLISGKPTATSVITNKVVTLQAKNSAGNALLTPMSVTITVLPVPSTALGTFLALTPRVVNVNNNLGARLDITATSAGSYTAKLSLGATTHSLTGVAMTHTLNGTDDAVLSSGGTALFTRTGGASTLRADFLLSGNQITGTLTDPATSGTASLTGVRNPWSAIAPISKATSYKGQYNLLMDLPSTADGDLDIPQGNSFASFTITEATGALTLAGRTADGLAVSSASFVGASGEVLYFSPLSTTLGTLLGQSTITLGGTAPSYDDNMLTGTATWQRLPTPATNTTERGYRAGFGPVTLTLMGGKYNGVANGTVVMGLPNSDFNAKLSFTAGGLTAGDAPDQVFSIRNTGLLKVQTIKMPAFSTLVSPNPNPDKVTFLLAAAPLGQFSGVFTVPNPTTALVRANVAYTGLIIRTAPTTYQAAGYFMLPQLPQPGSTIAKTPTLSGQIILMPATVVP